MRLTRQKQSPNKGRSNNFSGKTKKCPLTLSLKERTLLLPLPQIPFLSASFLDEMKPMHLHHHHHLLLLPLLEFFSGFFQFHELKLFFPIVFFLI
jgi:hypothetical protein